jgi:hypothetical protein
MSATLLDASTRAQLTARVQALDPGARPLWGRMDLVAMLNHLNLSFKAASGELRLKRALIGRLFGGVAKRVFLAGGRDFTRNSPTDPGLLQQGGDHEAARSELLQRIEAFAKPGGIADHPHAFFGPLTRDEWGVLMAKHLDHHLRQFGA